MKEKFLIAVAIFCIFLTARGAQDWQKEYDRLKAKIEAERGEPEHDNCVSKVFDEYIHWMGVKAADRDHAQELAAMAGNKGNPYWSERFLDLVELAQDSGESTLWMADYLFLRIRFKGSGPGADSWDDAVFKADYYGKRLFLRAQELGFDAEYIRESVRCLMRFALGDVEMSKYKALYEGRKVVHGTEYDAEGNLIMPDYDFVDITCLPRSHFHLESEGRQRAPVDKGLGWVEQIREICEWFELEEEYIEGTDMMDQFLQRFLCDDRFNQGQKLRWYLGLAQKHKLKKSEEYILGFFGTVHGKVEVQEGARLQAAAGAEVQITDKPDTLKTKANDNGRYIIEKAPLHCKCSPYPISAEYDGDRVESQYEGPLEKPMPSMRLKKDFLIPGSQHEWYGTLTIEQARRFNCDLEEEDENGSEQLNESEELVQRATIHLTSDDFDILRVPAVGAFPQPIEASGTITATLTHERTFSGQAKSTECVSKGEHKMVSPGNWMREHMTSMGEANHPVKNEHIRILFARDSATDKAGMEDMRNRMKELAQQAKEAAEAMDMDRVKEIQGEILKMQQGGGGDSVPLRIQVFLNYPSRDAVMVNTERRDYNVCLGRLTKDDSKGDSKEIQLILPMVVELKGAYIKGKDRSDRVVARMEDTDHKPSGRSGLGKQKCPDTEYRVIAELNLERRKK